MISLQNKYQSRIDELLNHLVTLGVDLKNAYNIKEASTSAEYKQKCIQSAKSKIDDCKKHILNIIIFLSKDEYLEKYKI